MPPKKITDEQEEKWEDVFDDYDRTIKTYSTMYALYALAQYWVENEFIIEQAAAKEAAPFGSNSAAGSLQRAMHDHTLIPMHRYSCIVMLYSTAERELLRLVENLEQERGQQKLKWKDIRVNGGKLEQISKFCEVFFDFRLKGCSQYAALTDLQKIRDCIVHCLGDVSLSGDKDFLVKLRQKRKGFFAHPNYEIRIGEECIKQFLKEVWDFFVSVFGVLEWEIAKHWKDSKPEKIFKKLKA